MSSECASRRRPVESDDLRAGPLEDALDAADVAVITLSVDDGVVRRWSPAAERIFGYRADEVVGRPDHVVLAAEARPDAAEARRAVLDGDWVVAAEERRTRSDGRPVDVLLTVAPLGTVAGEESLLALVVDITTRRRLEARLEQAERLEAIGRLAGGIAHDFNNVLTAVGGFASLAADGLDADDPRREDLDQVVAAAERGRALTQQLLAFSRRQVLQPTVVQVNAVVESMSSMLERLLGAQVSLTLGLDPSVEAATVDRTQLEQVVMNLAVNARDAMPHGGRLLIETASVVLDADYVASRPDARIGRHVLIAVSDEGTGIEEEGMASLFEPFYTTKGRQGTGLGLATVYGVVRQSGGHITVWSQPGFGTTFRIYLPATAMSPVADEGSATREPEPAGHGLVLLVEDDPAVRDFGMRALRAAGFDVRAASDAVSARRLAAAEPPDVLVSDVVLSGENGLALAASLRRDRPDLPVVLVSGHPESASVASGVHDAAGSFVAKPFSASDLVNAVTEALSTPP